MRGIPLVCGTVRGFEFINAQAYNKTTCENLISNRDSVFEILPKIVSDYVANMYIMEYTSEKSCMQKRFSSKCF